MKPAPPNTTIGSAGRAIGELHHSGGLQDAEPARFQQPSQQLGTSICIGDSHVIVSRIEVQALLHGDRAGNVLPAVPVETIRRSAHRLAEALYLLRLIAAPGRVARLGDPDLARAD